MQNINSKQVLKVTSILNTISGGLGVALGIVALVMGGFAVAGGAGSGLVATGAMAAGAGVAVIIAFAVNLALGILGIKAAHGTGDIAPVWTLSFLSLVLSGLSTFSSLASGEFGVNTLLSLVLVAVTFWAANDIKNASVAMVNA